MFMSRTEFEAGRRRVGGIAARLPTDLARLEPGEKVATLLAAAAKLKARPRHKAARHILTELGAELAALLEPERRPDWAWFEILFGPDACRMAEAMLRAGTVLGEKMFVVRGLQTLEWMRAGPGARRCARSLEQACDAAYAATGDARWLSRTETPEPRASRLGN
jgi:hypothetical protein